MTDSSEQNKTATPEQTQAGPQPFPYSTGGYPLPGTYPPFLAYPPPQSDSESSGSTVAPQFMMIPPPPPGMIYAFPPHPPGQTFPIPQIASANPAPAAPATTGRPKRKQVKMACTNCATACKRCDEARPCERCLKYGIADTCVDSQRKERKKGVKRGPYKRKNKSIGDFSEFPASEGSDWSNVQSPAATGTMGAIHAVPPFATPEGYYPVYYPPFALPVPEGQLGQEGAAQNGHPHPVVPYYFPPYYPHPYGFVPPPLAPIQPQADSSKHSEDRTDGSQNKSRMTKRKEPQAEDDDAEVDDSDTPAT